MSRPAPNSPEMLALVSNLITLDAETQTVSIYSKNEELVGFW